MTPYEEYSAKIRKNSNATMFARDSYTQKLVSNEELKSSDGYKPFESPFAFNPDLDTSEGLYNLSQKAGLGAQADRVIQNVGGETSKYMSGGFIMDSMDVLNTLSYGIAGLVKGKGFIEGVKNRDSFSDEDSLGKFGWSGKIAGFALDIALDPFTYIAPTKILAKVPGVTKAANKLETSLIGELKTIKIGGQELFQRVGGKGPLTYLANKLVYGFALDKKFLDGYQKILGAADNRTADAEKLLTIFGKLDKKITSKLIDFDEDGFQVLKSEEVLKRELGGEELDSALNIINMKKSLQQEMVDLGILSKDTADKMWDSYLKQEYDDFLLNKQNVPGKKGGSIGIDYRGRKYNLTREERMALQPVDDAAVVLGGTLVKQIRQIRDGHIQKFVADNFSITTDQLDEFVIKGGDVTQLHKVADSPQYTLRGKTIDVKKRIKVLNKQLKPAIQYLRDAYKDNNIILKEVTDMEARLKELPNLTEDALSDAFSDIKKFMKFVDSKTTFDRRPISKAQMHIADSITKWRDRMVKAGKFIGQNGWKPADEFAEFMKSNEGIVLEKAFNDRAKMFNFDTPREFYDQTVFSGANIKHTEGGFRETVDPEKISKWQQKRIDDAERYQKEFGALSEKLPNVKDYDLKFAQQSLIKAEAELSDLRFQKDDLLELLNENKLGQLAGRYIPKPMWDMLKETMNPDKEVGETLVLGFKRAKVIWNPSSYPRNAVSAMIQNWWKLGLGPWRLDVYLDAAKEMKNNGEAVQMMRKLGFSETSGVLNEMRANYINEKIAGEAAKSLVGTKFATPTAVLKHIDRTLVNSYGHIDNVAKVAAFKSQIKKGIDPETALKNAYAATYNYSEVTPFIHQMRRAIWGVPFITFGLKSVPLVASTLGYNPGRISVFGKVRNTLFEAAGVEGEQEGEAMPDWMRDDSFMLRLPWKDGEGRSMYFDLTYILPFGSIMTGEYLKNPIATNPVLQTVQELSRNKTFSGYKVFNESDDIETVAADLFIHVARKLAPPLLDENLLSQGYNDKGERVYKGFTGKLIGDGSIASSERNYYQEAAKLLGATVRPFDLESEQRKFDWNRKQALQDMLASHGVLDEFSKPYIPDDTTLPQPTSFGDKEVKPIGR